MKAFAKLSMVLLLTPNAAQYAFAQGDHFATVEVTLSGQSQTINCASEPAELSVKVWPERSDYTYTWSNGATTPTVLVKPEETTTYTVEVSNPALDFHTVQSFEVTVAAITAPTPAAITVCAGSEADICSTSDGTRLYYWNNGSMDMQHTIEVAEGTQTVSLNFIDECGTNHQVQRTLIGATTDAGFDQDVHASLGQIELTATAPTEGCQFYWTANGQPLANGQQVTADLDRGTSYEIALTVVDEMGCSSTSAKTVKMEDNISIPTAFSPNGDGHNDVFEIHVDEKYLSFQIKIFDRWGQLVYSSSDQYFRWEADPRVFRELNTLVYKIEAIAPSGERIDRTGTLNIIN